MSQTRVSIARVVRAYSFRVIASKGFWGWLRKKYPNGVPNPKVRSSRLKDTITVATLKRNAERGDKDSIRVVERERWAYEHERMSQAERERHEQTHNPDEELFHPGRARDFESLVKRGKQIRRDPLFSPNSAHKVDIITLALPGVGEQEFVHKRARFEEDLRATIRPGTLAQREQAAFGLDAVLGGETVVPATFFAGDPNDPNYKGVQLEEDGMDLYEGFEGDHRNNPQPVDFGSYQGLLSNARTLREAWSDLEDRDAFVSRNMTNPNNLFHNPSLERMFFLDVVLGNDDRHVSNVMVRDEGERSQELKDIHFSAIDNGLALPSATAPDDPGFVPQDTGPLRRLRKFMFKRPSKAIQERFKKVSLEDAARVIQKAGIRDVDAIRGALNRLAALKANPHVLKDYVEKSGDNESGAWQRFHSDSYETDFLESLGNSSKLDDKIDKLLRRYPPKDGYLEYQDNYYQGRGWWEVDI